MCKMILSQKKTCERCKALDCVTFKCGLGFAVNSDRNLTADLILPPKPFPKEPCYKPLTYKCYWEIRDFVARIKD